LLKPRLIFTQCDDRSHGWFADHLCPCNCAKNSRTFQLISSRTSLKSLPLLFRRPRDSFRIYNASEELSLESSETVMTYEECSLRDSFTPLACCPNISTPISFITSAASGSESGDCTAASTRFRPVQVGRKWSLKMYWVRYPRALRHPFTEHLSEPRSTSSLNLAQRIGGQSKLSDPLETLHRPKASTSDVKTSEQPGRSCFILARRDTSWTQRQK
jgi:hypothetical protein